MPLMNFLKRGFNLHKSKNFQGQKIFFEKELGGGEFYLRLGLEFLKYG